MLEKINDDACANKQNLKDLGSDVEVEWTVEILKKKVIYLFMKYRSCKVGIEHGWINKEETINEAILYLSKSTIDSKIRVRG